MPNWSKYKAEREKKRLNQKNKCWWCEEDMLPTDAKTKDGKLHPLAATMDHLKTRHEQPNRHKARFEDTVIAHHKCNHKRGREADRQFGATDKNYTGKRLAGWTPKSAGGKNPYCNIWEMMTMPPVERNNES